MGADLPAEAVGLFSYKLIAQAANPRLGPAVHFGECARPFWSKMSAAELTWREQAPPRRVSSRCAVRSLA